MLEIISASRRTDIPAFYYEWLQQCLKERSVAVKNPYNNSTYFVDLSPDKVHSICLWSKNFEKVLKDPGFLSLYNLYFQFTITGHPKRLEPHVVETAEAVWQMEKLAEKYSPDQINWRFDPIIVESITGNDLPEAGVLKSFQSLCRDVSSFGVARCTVSFLQLYKKVEQHLKASKISISIPAPEQQLQLLEQMVEAAGRYGISIYTCTSPILEKVHGVQRSSCIDGAFLEKLFGKKASRAKDAGQRPGCGCTRSKDIGSYNSQSCGHGCIYCYAQ